MAKEAFVSVVIPTRERCEAARRALLSLTRQTVPAGEYEVILSIDGSTDTTGEMAAGLTTAYELRVCDGPWRGRAAACNAGIRLAQGDVVILLDDDMEVVPEFIAHHRAHHSAGARLCVMGAVPVELDGRSPLAARHIAARFEAHMAIIGRPDHAFVPRDFYSGNASLRADVLAEVGGFDDSFGVYGNEDVELGVRLRAAGVTMRFDAEALARQHYTKDLRELARDTRAKGTTTVALARAHPEVFSALRLAAPRDASRSWLCARAVLLSLTRRQRRLSDMVFAVCLQLERAGLWRQPLFYRALLDYAFWTGVDGALRELGEQGPLGQLETELHRGPIDLLLHR